MVQASPSRPGLSLGRIPRSYVFLFFGLLLVGLALGIRLLHSWIQKEATQRIAQALKIPVSTLEIKAGSLHPRMEIRLKQVSFPYAGLRFSAEQVAAKVEMSMLVRGTQRRPRYIEASGLVLDHPQGHLRIGRATLATLFDERHSRVILHSITGNTKDPEKRIDFAADRVSVELLDGKPTRLLLHAVQQIRADTTHTDKIDVLVHHSEDKTQVRMVTKGGVLLALRQGKIIEADLDMIRLVLPPLLSQTVELAAARFTGKLHLRMEVTEFDRSLFAALKERLSSIQVRGEVDVENLGLHHPILAANPLRGLTLRLTGALSMNRGEDSLRLRAEELRVRLGSSGAPELQIGADVTLGADYRATLQVRLDETDCAGLLRSLPKPLIPVLEGLGVQGSLSGNLRLQFDSFTLPEVDLEHDLRVHCKVLTDAPSADPHILFDPNLTLERPSPDGTLRRLPLSSSADQEASAFQPLAGVPWHALRAFLVAEDNQFFQHAGFDANMIVRALGMDLLERQTSRGASTISQQLAKNLWLRQDRSLGRKLEEAVLTWRMEQVVGKERILELYLNMVELGSGIFGISMASAHYFGSTPAKLTKEQAAQLAALLPAPRRGMDSGWGRRFRDILARYGSAPVPHPSHLK